MIYFYISGSQKVASRMKIFLLNIAMPVPNQISTKSVRFNAIFSKKNLENDKNDLPYRKFSAKHNYVGSGPDSHVVFHC